MSSPSPLIVAKTSVTFSRKAGSSTVSESDWTITTSWTCWVLGNRSLSSVAVSSDSKPLDSRSSVVVALSSRLPLRPRATTTATTQRPMVTHGLRALIRASASVTETLRLAWGGRRTVVVGLT